MTDTVTSGSPSFQNGREPVYFEREGEFIATVVLNNPERLNAITAQMWQKLHQSILELSADDSPALHCHQGNRRKGIFIRLRYSRIYKSTVE